MQEKITRAKLNAISKKYEIDYSNKKMDQLCKELVKKGEKLICVSPRVVLRGEESEDDEIIKSEEFKANKTISKKSKSNKKSPKRKSPKSKSIKKSPKPIISEGEKINRKELIDIAKEYKISHTGKRMDVICEELKN